MSAQFSRIKEIPRGEQPFGISIPRFFICNNVLFLSDMSSCQMIIIFGSPLSLADPNS